MSLDEKTARRLAETIHKQEGRRKDFYRYHDPKELRAMRDLAYKMFGNRGFLDAGPDAPGVVNICVWEFDDPETPAQRRRYKVMATGNKISELVEQCRMYGISGRGI